MAKLLIHIHKAFLLPPCSPFKPLLQPTNFHHHRRSLTNYHQRNDTTSDQSKLIYQGKLAKRILYLKSISILTSLGLASSYGYVIHQKGLSLGLAGMGFAFTPFLLSPFAIAWFFKRYITHLYYNPVTDTYTAKHYGLLLNEKSCTFKREEVKVSGLASMLNTFTVGKRPFFLHDEDLIDVESIEIYKKMISLDSDTTRKVSAQV